MTARAPAYAALWIHHFALQAQWRGPRDAPVPALALLGGPDKKAVVTDLTPAALASGVERGFTPAHAQARCPGLRMLRADPSAEAEAQAALLTVGLSLAPSVELTAPGYATIDVTPLAPDRRQPALLVALDRLAELGLPATGGIAATPLLAGYAARHTETLFIVEDAGGFLGPLPLAMAEPPASLQLILAGWGVQTLGQLTDLPKAEIAHRLGPEGLALWERAAGGTVRPLQTVPPVRQFAAARDLEQAIETLEPLLFILRRFVDRLSLALIQAAQAAADMSLTLRLADDTAHARSFRLPEPTASADILLRTLHTHLESVHTAAPVIGVRLDLTPTRPLHRQSGLFENGLRDPHGFAETLARATAVVGSGRVGQPQTAATRKPDSFTLQPPPAVIPPAAPAAVLPPLGLALRRFRPPQSVMVELTAQAPSYVNAAAWRGAVCAALGPWHASGEWWQADQAWEREEWDIRLDTGGLYRLLHTPDGWFIEGEYD